MKNTEIKELNLNELETVTGAQDIINVPEYCYEQTVIFTYYPAVRECRKGTICGFYYSFEENMWKYEIKGSGEYFGFHFYHVPENEIIGPAG